MTTRGLINGDCNKPLPCECWYKQKGISKEVYKTWAHTVDVSCQMKDVDIAPVSYHVINSK